MNITDLLSTIRDMNSSQRATAGIITARATNTWLKHAFPGGLCTIYLTQAVSSPISLNSPSVSFIADVVVMDLETDTLRHNFKLEIDPEKMSTWTFTVLSYAVRQEVMGFVTQGESDCVDALSDYEYYSAVTDDGVGIFQKMPKGWDPNNRSRFCGRLVSHEHTMPLQVIQALNLQRVLQVSLAKYGLVNES